MRKSVIAILAVAIVVIIVIGGFLVLNNQKPSSPNTPTQTTAELMRQIRDQAMVYIEANNTQTVQLMQNLSWSGGRQETGLVGSETYIYFSDNWAVTIQYPVVQNPMYRIFANYTSDDVVVYWNGTRQNNPMQEISKTVNVSEDQTISTQEQVRDITMAYLGAYHQNTVQYMQGMMWTGGRMTPIGMMGAETYSYQGNGWNVTMQYPVVPNPIYTISAMMNSNGFEKISWQGTLHSGVMTENAYSFKP